MTQQDERFWVIFDTCTKTEYYADVHKLIALPAGWILRYDYRRQYLNALAEEAIFGAARQPSLALLAYAQSKAYKRGDEPPKDLIPSDMLYVATRMAHIALIPTPDGERAYFDIVVDGYPPPRGEAFDAIIEDLAQGDSVPYKKWIAISSQMDAYRALGDQARDANWEGIVDALGTPPAQFAGDTFWRLGLPNSGDEPVAEHLAREEDDVYQVESRFRLNEGREFVAPVVSHTPIGLAGGVEDRRYASVVTSSSRLEIVGSGQIELRRYSQDTARIRAIQTDQSAKTTEAVSFGTLPARQGWPPGPSFDLKFDVSKSQARIVIGILLFALAGGLGIAASANKGTTAYVLGGLAAISAILGYLAWTGKLSPP